MFIIDRRCYQLILKKRHLWNFTLCTVLQEQIGACWIAGLLYPTEVWKNGFHLPAGSGHTISLLIQLKKKKYLFLSPSMSLQTLAKGVETIHHPEEQGGEQNLLPQTRSCHPATLAHAHTRVHIHIHVCVWGGCRIQVPPFLKRRWMTMLWRTRPSSSVSWYLLKVPNSLDPKRTELPMEKPWFRQCSVKCVCIHLPLG